MSARIDQMTAGTEEPLTRAEAMAAGAARLIVGFLCIAPAALFPAGLAYRLVSALVP